MPQRLRPGPSFRLRPPKSAPQRSLARRARRSVASVDDQLGRAYASSIIHLAEVCRRGPNSPAEVALGSGPEFPSRPTTASSFTHPATSSTAARWVTTAKAAVNGDPSFLWPRSVPTPARRLWSLPTTSAGRFIRPAECCPPTAPAGWPEAIPFPAFRRAGTST